MVFMVFSISWHIIEKALHKTYTKKRVMGNMQTFKNKLFLKLR